MLVIHPPSLPGPRRGSVALLVAVCLIALVAVLAIAVDGGGLLEEYRHAQAVADSAALAAAADLYQNYQSGQGQEASSSGTAHQSALTTASANGYTNDKSTSWVEVRVSPQAPQVSSSTIVDSSGNLKPGYVEVIVRYNQPRGFSSVFSYFNAAASGPLRVTARSVARGQWTTFGDGIIVLNPTQRASLEANGNGTVSVQGADIIVDSNDSGAASTVGNAFVADDKTIRITGTSPGYSGDFRNSPTGSSGSATITTKVSPTPDPLAYLPVPPQTPSGQSVNSNKTYSLSPGYFGSSLKFSGQDSVSMAPGVYYINGDFSMAGQGTLTGSGVTIYCTGSLSITGNGAVTLSPPTSGTYKGMVYFQSRTSTATTKIAGNGNYNVTGTVYAKAAEVDVQGNGDTSIASQVVCDTMKAGGNGTINIVWNANTTANTRIIQLVE